VSDHLKLKHEGLDVYRAAVDFLALAARFLEEVPRGHGALAEQLRRAAMSMSLNIAEGYGKRTRDDRARFYHIARGSAHECGAILDVSRVLGVAAFGPPPLPFAVPVTVRHRREPSPSP
jgi:four helix bundle protein